MSQLEHLISILSSAREEAARLGASAQAIATQLDEALVEARSLAAHGGHPDEGKRPDELNSANDG